MTTVKHQVSPRRNAAPAARRTKRPAPVLVAGQSPAVPHSERPGELLADFTRLDSLAAGADSLLAQPSPTCPSIDGARRALAQAAQLADEARDAADGASSGRLGSHAHLDDLLHALALRPDGAALLLEATARLLESADWEASLPLVRAFPLLDDARALASDLAARLRAIRDGAIAERFAA